MALVTLRGGPHDGFKTQSDSARLIYPGLYDPPVYGIRPDGRETEMFRAVTYSRTDEKEDGRVVYRFAEPVEVTP